MTSLCIWVALDSLGTNLYSDMIMFYTHFSLFISSPVSSSPSVSGQCDLFMFWTRFCCHDVHRPPEFPSVTKKDRSIFTGYLSGASVSDMEQGRAAPDLWTPKSRRQSLALPEQSQNTFTDPQVWQGTPGAQRRSVWRLKIILNSFSGASILPALTNWTNLKP